jgi:hypothetical protein
LCRRAAPVRRNHHILVCQSCFPNIFGPFKGLKYQLFLFPSKRQAGVALIAHVQT